MRNRYDGIVDDWKVELVRRQARRRGFRREDIDDVLQEIVPVLLDFRFDPAQSNGASERAILTKVIAKRLMRLRRGRAVARRHFDRLVETLPRSPDELAADLSHLEHERRYAVSADIRKTVARFTPVERQVCEALGRGEPRFQLARRLAMSRYRLEQIIEQVRERLEAAGWEGRECR
jgi:hypothetical protein